LIYREFSDFKNNLPEYSKILAIDYGTSQIGLALSDPMRIIANAHSTIKFSSYKDQINAILKVIVAEKVGGIVIGWPLMPNGTEGDACAKILDFLKFFEVQKDIPIYLQDERYSTQAVTRMLIEMQVNRKKRSQMDDKVAATYILQTILDRMS
jgi:putative Holliday junction resolvase